MNGITRYEVEKKMKEKRGKRSELPLFIEDYQTKEWGIRMEGQGINWRSLALD